MPQFHFHTSDGQERLDPDGVELASSAQARTEALRQAAEMLKRRAAGGPFDGAWQMRVTDARGLTLYHLDFLLTESAAVVQPI